MKKIFLTITFIILNVLILIGCNKESEDLASVTENNLEVKPDPVEETLKNMTLTEKIGQMTMIGVYGYDIDENNLWMLHQYHCGGVILFNRNIDSKSQVKQFIKNLQEQSEEKVPLFIAVDEEGGRVSRLKQIEDKTAPSQEEIGNSGEIEAAKIWAENISDELKLLGINVNFAPVADVGSPDTRSFSNNAATVASFVNSAANGYESKNIIYCLKHFPGIGKRITDPHQEISSIDVSRETLEKEDILPFKFIIDNHESNKFMVMVSHLKYPAIDENNSATLSNKVMSDLLRNKLGYDGIIITDDLEMGAIANHNTFKDVGVKAVEAGADIVLVCHDYTHEQDVYLVILEAVQNGKISEERINESTRRILKVKLNNLSS